MNSDLHERIERLLLRILDEQVPVMCSDRIKMLHHDARKLLIELSKASTDHE